MLNDETDDDDSIFSTSTSSGFGGQRILRFFGGRPRGLFFAGTFSD